MAKKTAVRNNGNRVFYGLDHACGWFYQEYATGNDEPIMDIDTVFGGLSKGRLLDLLEDTDAPEQDKFNIAMDIAP
jgi:hypothetical protein